MYSRYLESPIYDHLNISKNTGNLPSLFNSIDSSRRAQQLCFWFRFDWTKRLTGNSPNESPTARHLLTFFRTNFFKNQFIGDRKLSDQNQNPRRINFCEIEKRFLDDHFCNRRAKNGSGTFLMHFKLFFGDDSSNHEDFAQPKRNWKFHHF